VRGLANPLPDKAAVAAVLETAARAPSLKNLQPWRWRVDRSAVHLYADWDRRAGDSPNDRRDVLLGCGAVLHHCAVAFAATGWHPRVQRFSDPADDTHLAVLEVIEQPPDEAQMELAAAIPLRRADRRPFSTERIPAGTIELLHARAARMQVELSVVPRPRWIRRDDGEVALRYADGAGADAPADGAVLLILGTAHDDDPARLRTGEALSNLLLTAAALGLAACPLTEPLRDPRSRLMVACEVFDGHAHPQALIRIGLPVSDADPLPLVTRRPLHETTVWTD
jgi:nitroreductase